MNRHERRAQNLVVLKDTKMRMLVICVRVALYGVDPKQWPKP